MSTLLPDWLNLLDDYSETVSSRVYMMILYPDHSKKIVTLIGDLKVPLKQIVSKYPVLAAIVLIIISDYRITLYTSNHELQS